MAQIPYSEAIELGLVPRRLEEALEAWYAQQGRYPSGFPRSRGALSPLWRVPPFLAFSRGRGIQPMPFGNPPRTAAQPLRFGLYPLELGLGLSPAASALMAGPPVGRAAAARGGIADVATLLARGMPQDIAEVVRRFELGLLPISALPALAQAGLLPPQAVARVLAAPSVPTGRPTTVTVAPTEGGDGFADVLGGVRKALSAATEAEKFSRGEGLPRQITDALGITEPVPPGSFEMTPETRTAFEAQRAGERVPVPAAPTADPEAVRALAEGAALALQEAATGLPAFAEGVDLGVGTLLPSATEAVGSLGPTAAQLATASQAIPGAFSLTQEIPEIASLAAEAGIQGLGEGGASIAQQFAMANEPALLDVGFGGVSEAGGAAAQLAPVLSAIGKLVGGAGGLYTAITADDPVSQGLGALSAASAIASFIPGPHQVVMAPLAIATGGFGLLKSLFGGLFGGGSRIPHAVRDAMYRQQVRGEAQQFASELSGSDTLPGIWNTLVKWSSGYVGGTAPRAIGFTMYSETPEGIYFPEGIYGREGQEQNPGRGPNKQGLYWAGPGNKNSLYPVASPEKWFAELIKTPEHFATPQVLGGGEFDMPREDFKALLRRQVAEAIQTNPDDPMAQGVIGYLTGKAPTTPLAPAPGAATRPPSPPAPTTPSATPTPTGWQPQPYAFTIDPATGQEIVTMWTSPPGGGGSSPEGATLPSIDMSTGVLSGISGLRAGTPYVPRTGLYRLHQGEAVLPRPVAARLRRLAQTDTVIPPQPDQLNGHPLLHTMLPTDTVLSDAEPLYPQLERLSVQWPGLPFHPLERYSTREITRVFEPAGRDMTEEEEADLPWYIAPKASYVQGATPFQAQTNPDPSQVWRLATSDRDVREALTEGEPVVAVTPNLLRRARRGEPGAFVEIARARRRQYDQPGEGIETLDAIARALSPATAGKE